MDERQILLGGEGLSTTRGFIKGVTELDYFAASERTELTLIAGVVVGMTITLRVPSAVAPLATPWA